MHACSIVFYHDVSTLPVAVTRSTYIFVFDLEIMHNMNRYNLENFDHEYYRRTVSKVSYIFVAILSSTFICINLYILLISKAGKRYTYQL